MASPLFGESQLATTMSVLGISGDPILGQTEQQLLRQIAVAAANRTGGGGGGSGTVTSVSVVTDNGVSGSVANPTTTPAISLTLGNITPTRVTINTAGSSSTSELGLTGSIFSGGSATTTKPKFLIEPTGTTSTGWSTAGTGFGINAPSGFVGDHLNLQTNGVLNFKVGSNGALRMAYFGTNIDIYDDDNTTRRWWCTGGRTFARDFNTTDDSISLGGDGTAALRMGSAVSIGWSSTLPWFGAAADTTLSRAGVGILAQGSGNILRLGVTAVASGALVSTHSVTIQDATGTTYRIPTLV